MYCRNCGTNVGDARFCPNCGAQQKAAYRQADVPEDAYSA